MEDRDTTFSPKLRTKVPKVGCLRMITDRIPARLVLYFLSWSGFLVSFMMRNDINFALVAMVRDNNPNSSSNDNCVSSSAAYIPTMNGVDTNYTMLLNNTDEADLHGTETREYYGDFDWDSTVQSVIKGSFYWCYVLSQVVGGVATQYFGTKSVFGWSQFFTAASSLCIPYAADIHYGAVIMLRSVQGFASGLTWPAMYAIVGYWIPPVERSRFMSSFQGFSIGIGLTYPLCGFIIAYFGWRLVFYTTGTIGMIWCVFWYLLAYNTPQEHPRITSEELEYIELNVSEDIKNGQGMKVPWKKIFTSVPVWAIGLTTFGRIWVHYTFIMSGPEFMQKILCFDIKENGLLSGTPFLCSYLSSVLFCYIADILMDKKMMTLTNVRKLFTALSQIVPGVLVLLVGYLGSNLIAVLVLWFVAVTFITASYAGAMANIVDIAPNLAGPVLAFAQTIHMTASFLQPLASGIMVTDAQNINQWQHVFGVSSVVAISSYLIFQLFGTAEIQSWNYPIPDAEIISTDDSAVIANQPMLKVIGSSGGGGGRGYRYHDDDDNDGNSSSSDN
ncbi:sialin [Toxorhynchites rutilus septentrionalis]|uniref:sialin n=1 Tax=Toxorhynchites rutilus septentrionalis TaxID=329112 RepID=UPI00247AEE54|nr:sialin [Toxorhynchites rutilus septentrionalis]XP_055642171.1 sialin [Toxorhynchites rutilus septentrionalis]XP_055642179.1 sialin [Toxorhynchites rutilus septentrionalis]XP_055642188.1 sialin [Toxorhynchites rutilus septentrionalis]XP_055642197.1 sialin [Toxorhynchites rutilus septentrionalis]XP_055642204.1 sialin [Toxorhynchites rutilus septentrionalis]